MSALGQKQTCAAQKVMSALLPIADIQDFVLTKRKTPGRYSGAFTLFTDYFGASGPTNLRPLGPVPLTWINVGSRIST
jgi:hypothetical protein